MDTLFLDGELNINYKHGYKGTRLYNIWALIKQRCLNINNKDYSNYGGRGITISNEWLEFIPFRNWALRNGYQYNLTIDRINNEGNYEPNNCQWLSVEENAKKKRNNKLTLEIANEIRTLHNSGYYTQKELAYKFGVCYNNINFIIHNKIWKNI